MACTLVVTRVTRLVRARLVLLEGELLAGAVLVDHPAEFEHAGQRRAVQVLGVLGVPPVTGTAPCVLQVTVDAHQLAGWAVAPGDRLHQV
jgi:hypothetical protein